MIDKQFFDKILVPVAGSKKENREDILREILPIIKDTLDKYDINTELRICHFIAQLAHESDGFCTTEEYASGTAYESRADLGNTSIGDGRKYKGRGLIQLTGKANYTKMADTLNTPLDIFPCIAADPIVSLDIACEYWRSRDLNGLADKDDIEAITRKINGGVNGLTDRKSYYKKCRENYNSVKSYPVLKQGSNGDYVKELQRLLNAKGANLNIDGDFGKNTFDAVVVFQKKNNLADDGIVGNSTWSSLNA